MLAFTLLHTKHMMRYVNCSILYVDNLCVPSGVKQFETKTMAWKKYLYLQKCQRLLIQACPLTVLPTLPKRPYPLPGTSRNPSDAATADNAGKC